MNDRILDTDHGVHAIGEAVKVYLEFDGKTWRVAPTAVDGHPLDSPYDHTVGCDRTHDADPKAAAECEQLVEESMKVDLPTAAELIPLIAEHLSPLELLTAVTALHQEAVSRG